MFACVLWEVAVIWCFEVETVYWVWSERALLVVLGRFEPFTHPLVCKPIFSCVMFQVVLADGKMFDSKWLPSLTWINMREMEVYFRRFLCWSIKRYTLCHQKMLESALKKQKNARVADAITVICCPKSPPEYRDKMEVKKKITEKKGLCFSKSEG